MTDTQPSLIDTPDSPLWSHGSDKGWRSGCRCFDCETAHKGVQARQFFFRSQRIKINPSLAPHGVDNTYLHWGCRCELCTNEHKRVMKKYHADRKAREARWAKISEQNRQSSITEVHGEVNMNKRVITLLTGALAAAIEEDDRKAMQLTHEALGELWAAVDTKIQIAAPPVVAPKVRGPYKKQGAKVAKATKKQYKGRAPKVQEETKVLIWERHLAGESTVQLARAFGLATSTTNNILTEKKRANGIAVKPFYGNRGTAVNQ